MEEVQKHHITVRDLKSGDGWVASRFSKITPPQKPWPRRVQSHGFGMTNRKDPGEYLAEGGDNLNRADREEWLKTVNFATSTFLEGFLEKGIIRLSSEATRRSDKDPRAHALNLNVRGLKHASAFSSHP